LLEHGIKLDLERQSRLGFDEAVYAETKSAAQLRALVENAAQTGARRLFTRLSERQYAALSAEHRGMLDYDPVSATAIFGGHKPAYDAPRTAIVCAGSSDAAASREAARTLAYYGHPSSWIPDVGVAGLWRLLEHLDEIRDKDVVIVAAGMDGALPSVVGGLVPGVVIALPTSVGYGAGEGGKAALASALSSCAPGVVVVNIDNGYGAACAAVRILRQLHARTAP
jgi:NCAIR mutase (PurE)-related protein